MMPMAKAFASPIPRVPSALLPRCMPAPASVPEGFLWLDVQGMHHPPPNPKSSPQPKTDRELASGNTPRGMSHTVPEVPSRVSYACPQK